MQLLHTVALITSLSATAVQALAEQSCLRFVNEQWPLDADWRDSLFVLNYPREDVTFNFPVTSESARRLNNYRLRPALALGSSSQSKFSEWSTVDHRNFPTNRRTTAGLFWLTPSLDFLMYNQTRKDHNNQQELPWSRSLSYNPGVQGRFSVADVILNAFQHSRNAPTDVERDNVAWVERSRDGELVYGRAGSNLVSDFGRRMPPDGYARLYERPDDNDLIRFWDWEWAGAPLVNKDEYPTFVDEPRPAVLGYHEGVFLCNLPPAYRRFTDNYDDDPGARLAPYYLRLGSTHFYNFIKANNGGPESCQHGHLQLCSAEDLGGVPEEYFDDGGDSYESDDDLDTTRTNTNYIKSLRDIDELNTGRIEDSGFGTGERDEVVEDEDEEKIHFDPPAVPITFTIPIDDEIEGGVWDVESELEDDDAETYTQPYDAGDGFNEEDDYTYNTPEEEEEDEYVKQEQGMVKQEMLGQEEVKQKEDDSRNPDTPNPDENDRWNPDTYNPDEDDDEEIMGPEAPKKNAKMDNLKNVNMLDKKEEDNEKNNMG